MSIKTKLSNVPNLVYGLIGAVVVLGSVAGGALFMDDRHANAEQTVKSMIMLQKSIQKTNTKIDMHAMQQRIDGIQAQLWKIEDRTGTTDPVAMPVKERERYRALTAQKLKLERELKATEAALKAPGQPEVLEGNVQ